MKAEEIRGQLGDAFKCEVNYEDTWFDIRIERGLGDSVVISSSSMSRDGHILSHQSICLTDFIFDRLVELVSKEPVQ